MLFEIHIINTKQTYKHTNIHIYLCGGLSMPCFKMRQLNLSKLFSLEFTVDFSFWSVIKISFIIDKKVEVRIASNA